MRYFNTSGPCFPGQHYMVPAEPRLPEARPLIEQGRFFVVHAPRQTGKTTTLMALAQELTAEGRHVALRFSCESGEVANDDYGAAEAQVLDAIRREARTRGFPAEWMPPTPWPDAPTGRRIYNGLQDWALKCPLPLVLFFDEIDALRGQSLTSVLRQLRDGFSSRPHAFPSSIVLCGLRDVRDYRAASGADPDRIGTASPFNVKVASLRIGDFTREQVVELYEQHTADTGQEFTPEALDLGWEYSRGQPYLANAIAYEIVDRMRVKPPAPITAEHVETAKERLVLARETHLDSLTARLNEPRVRRFIEPLIAGDLVDVDATFDDDLSYVRDLGLIAPTDPPTIANPIYKEIIVRVLGSHARANVLANPRGFLLPDGQLDFRMMAEEFAAWWRQHGEFLVKGEVYHEVAPQLIIMAFLTRIVNGEGSWTASTELAVAASTSWCAALHRHNGKSAVQREAVEVKVRRKNSGDPLAEGLAQLDGYLDRLGLDTGTLLNFRSPPQRSKKAPRPKVLHRAHPDRPRDNPLARMSPGPRGEAADPSCERRGRRLHPRPDRHRPANLTRGSTAPSSPRGKLYGMAATDSSCVNRA